MIIGDTMENKTRLVDMNFKSIPLEEKRAVFVLMDVMMKKLHEKNLMVTDFSPTNVYFQNGIYFFEKVSPISSINASNKEEALLKNLLGLSNLAFCSYLPDYRLESGLLSHSVISDNFNNFSSYLPEEDRSYYKAVLVDSYSSGKLPGNPVYYSDYLIKQYREDTTKDKKSSLAFVKATEAGRALANQDEAAFGHNFFFLTVVASVTIMLFGVVFYFFSYLG